MAFVEYILLALLGSSGAAAPGGTPGSPSTRTLDGDAVTQPYGGVAGAHEFRTENEFLAQTGGGTTDRVARGKKGAQPRQTASRRHRKHRGVSSKGNRRVKPDAFTVKQTRK